MYRVYAVFIGILISIMLTFNGVLDGYLGNYLSVLLIHLCGLITVTIILISKRQKIVLNRQVPFYLYSGGAIGVLLVLVNNICFSSLGVALTSSLGVFGQLMLSCVIDHFGIIGMDVYKFEKKKLIGFTIILAGIIVMTIY
ncbi:DMT family transporter [Tissierella sp. MSJ-40]|uniref:DMT family transporter n=1 Tax=Tissierella simiarum TaxID=2841534 RepID=A0ABS6E7E7_9FIRM|nr:DMT family transporter [Tissierella simiarum]MBU5438839.1 DMT family transporter [Tissierella simiarum]